ncbi:hypothetical protein [Paenibacillus sp. PL91]|uniref:hypothetical protein n=1 Tax=Paenibacillus sp. PL91 TaxID=2729538 RepID=UPI00145F889D|nr:hypothetical protein [Paenibacillus sp. PL91]MBC9200815.1 hypothetical protein [Paenibacillus sp. PL91]
MFTKTSTILVLFILLIIIACHCGLLGCNDRHDDKKDDKKGEKKDDKHHFSFYGRCC